MFLARAQLELRAAATAGRHEDDDDEIVAQEYEDLMHGANGLSNEEFRPRPSVTARRRQSVLPKREKAGADLGFLLTNQRDVREGAADADVSGTATRRKSSLGGKDRPSGGAGFFFLGGGRSK